MTNQLDGRAHKTRDIEMAVRRILVAIKGKLPDIGIYSLGKSDGPTIPYRSGFKVDSALLLSNNGNRRALFIGHFKQGGGYRILIQAAHDKNEPTHVIRIRTGDESEAHKWIIQRGIAKRSKGLDAVLQTYDNAEKINTPATSPLHQVGTIAALIVHAVAPEHAMSDIPKKAVKAIPFMDATRSLWEVRLRSHEPQQ